MEEGIDSRSESGRPGGRTAERPDGRPAVSGPVAAMASLEAALRVEREAERARVAVPREALEERMGVAVVAEAARSWHA